MNDPIVTNGIILDFMPRWVELAIAGPLVVYFIVVTSVVLSKAGRHSAWSLLMLFPVVQIVAIWVFALCTWPRVESKK